MATKKIIKKTSDSVSKLFEEAIADAKTLRETALVNAKKQLEEAFAPKLQAMFSEKVRQEVEGDGDDYENPDEPDMIENDESNEEDLDIDIPELDENDDEEIPTEDETDETEEIPTEDELDFDLDFDLEDDGENIEDSEEDVNIEEGEEGEDEIEEPEIEDELTEEGENDEVAEDVPVEDEVDEDDLELEAILKELDGEDEIEEPAAEDEDEELTEDEIEEPAEPVEDEDDDEIDLDEILNNLTEEDEVEAPKESEELKEAKLQNQKLTKKLTEAVKVIKIMKTQLAETNLLNSKLYYANKIFKNNEKLTEGQKMKVIDQFDRATTLREVKLVYTTMLEAIKSKKAKVSTQVTKLTEGIASKVTGTTKPSKKIITEGNEIVKRFQKLANI